jgi:hypothetical protein
MFAEDLSVFMRDFGLVCLANSVTFTGLLDSPDELIGFQSADTQTRQYTLRYSSAAVTLRRKDLVQVAGVNYQVREVPDVLADGAFTRALLSKQ